MFLDKSYKILTVSDDKESQEQILKKLEPYNFKIELSESPKESIDIIESFSPSIILVSISEKDCSFVDDALFLYKENKEYRDIPLMIISHSNDDSAKAHFFDMGADDFMVHPLLKQEIIARIKRHSQSYYNKKELQKAYLEVEKLSRTDALTSISNRMHINSFLEEEWDRAKRDIFNIAILMCDIDCFKEYNDSLGHLKGDECLAEVARALAKACPRKTDLVGRYGGEEFIIVLHKPESIEDIRHIADKIKKSVAALKIEHPKTRVENHKYISLSIGGNIVDGAQSSILETIHQADKNLYYIKQHGRNNFKIT